MKVDDLLGNNPEKPRHGNKKQPPLNLIVTTKGAAEFFSVNQKTVVDWGKNKGAPKVSTGKWDLKKLFDWWYKRLGAKKAVSDSSISTETDAKRRYLIAKAVSKELDTEAKRGNLIDKKQNDIDRFNDGRLVRDAILNVPDRINSILAAEDDPVKCREILMAELRAALEELAKLDNL